MASESASKSISSILFAIFTPIIFVYIFLTFGKLHNEINLPVYYGMIFIWSMGGSAIAFKENLKELWINGRRVLGDKNEGLVDSLIMDAFGWMSLSVFLMIPALINYG